MNSESIYAMPRMGDGAPNFNTMPTPGKLDFLLSKEGIGVEMKNT